MSADIDVDFKDRQQALAILPHIPALMQQHGQAVRHNTGVYFQSIPTNPLNGLASIPFRDADAMNYFKIDFINNSVYEFVVDHDHLDRLLATEPVWDLLADREIVGMLAHIHEHFEIVDTIKPQSVDDLAVILALIRPGKRALLNKSRAEIDAEIWNAPLDGSYHFKKAHAYAYAVSITVQLNLLAE